MAAIAAAVQALVQAEPPVQALVQAAPPVQALVQAEPPVHFIQQLINNRPNGTRPNPHYAVVVRSYDDPAVYHICIDSEWMNIVHMIGAHFTDEIQLFFFAECWYNVTGTYYSFIGDSERISRTLVDLLLAHEKQKRTDQHFPTLAQIVPASLNKQVVVNSSD